MTIRRAGSSQDISTERGFTLIEAMIAILIMLCGLLAIGQILTFCLVASKTYGRDATRATTFAHDKMEELTGLGFTDTTTNVTVAAPFTTDGVGLTQGGSVPPATPATGYSDYLDISGARTAAEGAAYTRQWQIIDDSTGLKRVIVTVTSNKTFRYGSAPATTMVTFKAQ